MEKIRNEIKNIIKSPLFIIILLIIIFRIIYFNFCIPYQTYPDTKSYITNFNENILKGQVNVVRTPVYPYIIKFLSVFSNSEDILYRNITIFQELISLLSVVFLYITLKKILKNKSIINITTLFYGCLPTIFIYNKVILTESLSISASIFLFYFIVNYLKNSKTYKIILISLYTFFLIMLRPSFLFIIILLFILWILKIIFNKKMRKQAIIGLISLVGILILISGYQFLNYKTNGFKGLSRATITNQIDIIVKMNIYGNYQQGDEKFVNIIENNYKKEEAPWYVSIRKVLLEEFDYSQIDEYNKRCIKNNISTYLKETIKNTLSLSGECLYHPIISAKTDNIHNILTNINTSIFPITFGFVYLMLLLEFIYLIYVFIKSKKIQWIRLLLILLITGQFATALIGAQAEYKRLVVNAIPFIIILLVSHIDQINYYYKNNKKEDYI